MRARCCDFEGVKRGKCHAPIHFSFMTIYEMHRNREATVAREVATTSYMSSPRQHTYAATAKCIFSIGPNHLLESQS